MNAKQPITDLSAETTAMEDRYQRAQTIMQGLKTQKLVQNDLIVPHWIDNTDCFWYERTDKTGKAYRLVNAATLTNEVAFNHADLASALSKAADQSVNTENLPLSEVTISLSPRSVLFTAFNRRWEFNCVSQSCNEIDKQATAANELTSPDGRWVAFVREHNIGIREVATNEETFLTQDGEAFFAYAAPGTAYGMQVGNLMNAQWSPDSQRLLTVQKDMRQVKTLPMVDHIPADGSIRPKVEFPKVAYPGDEHVEEYRLLAIDITSGQQCDADYRRIPVAASDTGFLTSARLGWWANDSQRAYFIDQERGDQVLRLVEFNTDTGATRILFEETSDTQIMIKTDTMDMTKHQILADTQELIWWSERSGWGHLYLYDLNTGELKHPITQGNWRVRDILHIDTTRRELLIQTTCREDGKNPYYRDICRVNIDTGELTTLVSSDDEYLVHILSRKVIRLTDQGYSLEETNGVAPSGRYVVTTRTRADQVPTSLLFNAEGERLLELETADISGLPAGWQWPEPVKLLAADGHTDIYGVVFRPSNFCADKQYPVINMIVGGPWFASVPHGSFHTSRGYADRYYFQGAALAELGFIVVVIDSRGTPLRDKAFQDTCYGWIPSSANTEDHRAALEQLASRYPEMDLNRVGVFSPTGYQGGIQNLLECPDLYQTGVINLFQDSRLIGCTIEGDKYHGVDGPSADKRYPEQLAENWQGKLLLIHAMYGVCVPCYPPAGTLRLVDALRKANKDFDLLMLPHAEGVMGSYEMRRAWDYLVRHLQGVEPPKEFLLGQFAD